MPKAKEPPQNLDAVRQLILDKSSEPGRDLKAQSKAIGRNDSYMFQFVHRGSPQKLDEEDRLKLAAFLRVSEAQLRLHEMAEGPHVVPVGPVQTLPIRFKVGAGLWHEIDEASQDSYSWEAISPRPDIPLTDQWIEQVVGDSFDMRYPEGTLLHVRAAWAFDPLKLHGRRVIVQRTRDGGALVERTVKEVVITAKDGIELWPRSFNPKWSKPIRFKKGLREDDTVEIVGLVLSATILETR